MARLGDLERSVMDVLWESGAPVAASEIQAALVARLPAALALTTVMTVLSRLEKKGVVVRDRGVRPHVYRAVSSRADHTAELMHEVLDASPDRQAALARFVGQVTPAEAAALRRLLDLS